MIDRFERQLATVERLIDDRIARWSGDNPNPSNGRDEWRQNSLCWAMSLFCERAEPDNTPEQDEELAKLCARHGTDKRQIFGDEACDSRQSIEDNQDKTGVWSLTELQARFGQTGDGEKLRTIDDVLGELIAYGLPDADADSHATLLSRVARMIGGLDSQLKAVANLLINGVSRTDIAKRQHSSPSTISRRCDDIADRLQWVVELQRVDSQDVAEQKQLTLRQLDAERALRQLFQQVEQDNRGGSSARTYLHGYGLPVGRIHHWPHAPSMPLKITHPVFWLLGHEPRRKAAQSQPDGLNVKTLASNTAPLVKWLDSELESKIDHWLTCLLRKPEQAPAVEVGDRETDFEYLDLVDRLARCGLSQDHH